MKRTKRELALLSVHVQLAHQPAHLGFAIEVEVVRPLQAQREVLEATVILPDRKLLSRLLPAQLLHCTARSRREQLLRDRWIPVNS